VGMRPVAAWTLILVGLASIGLFVHQRSSFDRADPDTIVREAIGSRQGEGSRKKPRSAKQVLQMAAKLAEKHAGKAEEAAREAKQMADRQAHAAHLLSAAAKSVDALNSPPVIPLASSPPPALPSEPYVSSISRRFAVSQDSDHLHNLIKQQAAGVVDLVKNTIKGSATGSGVSPSSPSLAKLEAQIAAQRAALVPIAEKSNNPTGENDDPLVKALAAQKSRIDAQYTLKRVMKQADAAEDAAQVSLHEQAQTEQKQSASMSAQVHSMENQTEQQDEAAAPAKAPMFSPP